MHRGLIPLCTPFLFREVLLNARQRVAVHVNTELLSTYWNIGKIIVEHEQSSKERADYGKQTLKQAFKRFDKKSLEKDFRFPIFNLCVGFTNAIKFNRRCLLNCHGRIIVNYSLFQTQTRGVFTKRKLSIPGGRYAALCSLEHGSEWNKKQIYKKRTQAAI